MIHVRHLRRALLALAVTTAGCELDFRPVLAGISPLNGETAVDPSVKPVITLATGVQIDAGEGHVVLVDVTGGVRRTVAGSIEVAGTKLTYHPKGELLADRTYELVIEQQAVSGEKLLDVDGTEWPEEPLSWPYRARFSTSSRPGVRGVYLDQSRDKPRLFVRFSQPMDQVVTSGQFTLIDELSNDVPFGEPVWVDDATARLDTRTALEPAGVYTLQISERAKAGDGSSFDGDGDGKPGEIDDSFTVRFTGSQAIVRSRL